MYMVVYSGFMDARFVLVVLFEPLCYENIQKRLAM
jgi:hypothetical protein